MNFLRVSIFAAALMSPSFAEDAKEPVKPPIKPEMVKAEVFKQRYHRVGMAETMHHTEFVGVVDGVAILKVGDMHLITQGWREKWLGVKVADLDPVFRADVEKRAAEIRAKQEAQAKAKEAAKK